jgi:hypothetical protein
MSNHVLIKQLVSLGKLPSDDDIDSSDFPLKEFDDLLQEFNLPIDFDIAVQLMNLSPPVGESCFEVEWALVHLVETLGVPELEKVLDMAEDGEVKRIIRIRLNNYNRDLSR